MVGSKATEEVRRQRGMKRKARVGVGKQKKVGRKENGK